ncbi:hypothetical protein HKX48_006785 [Thoreauomyces humboldtii]|nr:hypothetical protein HKX48_006785 [Thoreauomyces humboldtii]
MPSVSPTARRTPAARPHPKLVLPSDKALGPTQLQALTQALLANSASTVVTKKPHRKSITGASLMPSSAEGSPAPPPKRSHKKRRVDSSSATSTFRRGLRDDNSDAASTQAGGSAEDTSGDETVREGDAGRSRRRSGTANRDRARHVGTGFDGEDFEDGDMEWNHDDGGDAGMETGDVDEEVEALTRELSFDPQTLLDDADTEAAVESATAKLQSRITELRARLSDSETVHEEMETCRYEMTELDREMDVVLAAIIRKAARSARHAARESVSQHPSVQESASSEPPNPASEQPTSNDEEEEEDDDDGLSEDKGGEGDAGTRRRMPRRPSPLVYPGSTTVWHPAFPFPIAPVETDEDEVLEETVFTTRLEREEVPVVLDFCRAVKARGHRLFNRLGHYLAARDDRQQDAGAGDAGRGDATDPSGLARDKKDAAAALDLLGLGQDHVAVPASAVGSVF